MATIVPFLQPDTVFGPKDIQAMAMALDDVCKALQLADDAKRPREVIALRIIELARYGVRSPTQLRDRVLSEASGDPCQALSV